MVPVVLRSAAPSSCGPAIAEADDFPSASIPAAVYNVTPALGEFGGAGAEARPQLASMDAVVWFLRDLDVFSVFSGVCCTSGTC